MTKRLRAVLDANVFVSAFLSRSPTSPTKELIRRWEADEFSLLISDALIDELIEKLFERKISPDKITEFVMLLERLAEWILVSPEAVQAVIADDPDDDLILACAVVGKADYLITYDSDFDFLLGEYQGLRIVKAIPFLEVLRNK